MDLERRRYLQTGKPSRVAGALVFGIILLPAIHGVCLSLTSTKAEPFRTYAKITWGIGSVAPGCSVLNWMVHYDSVSPARIYQNRNNTGSYVNQSYVRVYPNFEYNVFVEAFTNQGVVRSPVFVYHAPKARPGSAPGKLHMLSVTHDSISLKWDALSLFYKNGNILGYKLTYRLAGNSTEMYTNVQGESTLTGDIRGLQPSTHYQIRVQCVNDMGLGPPSSPWLDITTSALPTSTSTTTTTTTTTTPTTTTTTATTTTTPTTTTTTKPTVTTPTTPTTTTAKIIPNTKTLPVIVSITPAASNPKTSASTTKLNRPSPQATVPLVASGVTPVSTSTTGSYVTSHLTKSIPSTYLIHTTTPSATTRKDAGDDKILGLDLWMLVAIACGVFLLLLLLSVLLCCCCRCCCFEEAAVGAKTRGEERVFDKRGMDGVFTDRDARRDNISRKPRTMSVVSMESLDGYSEVKPRTMRLVSVDSHHSLDAIPILVPSSAGRYSTRNNTPMAKASGTQYERIHTTPKARATGTQYEDVTERVIYASPKFKTFGTQYESIEEEMPTKDIGTITDRRGSINSSVSPFPSNTSSARTPRTLRAVAPMQINPEVLTPIVMTTMDASTSAMSSPERRFKSANVQTDLSVLEPPTPIPQSYSTKSKSTGYPLSAMPKDVEAEIDVFPSRPLIETHTSLGNSSVSIPSTAMSDHKVPFSDIASCPTVVPLRPQDIPRTRDHSYLRYPSKAASHPLTIWDIPLKSYPDSITYPSKDSSGDVTPSPMNRIEYNTIYDNRVSNTDNTYIHNFLEDAQRMARKPKVSRPPRLAAIPANLESPVGLYDPFPETGDAHDIIKPGLEKHTTFNNIPAVKGPEVRAILYEPLRLKDSTDC